MKQLQLFKSRCPCVDDTKTRCSNNMTDEEMEQDGMCSRCAELLWDWMQHKNKPFLFERKK